jgi:hypothetical protein
MMLILFVRTSFDPLLNKYSITESMRSVSACIIVVASPLSIIYGGRGTLTYQVASKHIERQGLRGNYLNSTCENPDSSLARAKNTWLGVETLYRHQV